MKICPTDWKEGIAMVASGGIYCQFKQAQYILEDFEAEVAAVRVEAEAERDEILAGYANAASAQVTAMQKIVADYQDQLAKLQAAAEKLKSRAIGFSPLIAAASTLAPDPSSSRLSRMSSVVPRTRPISTAKITAATPQSPIEQKAKEVAELVEEAVQKTQAKASGPFAAAGGAIDSLVSDARDELSRGFESELFGPLALMLSGIVPPPDPATLYTMMNLTKIELLRIINAKNDWLDRVRAQQEAALKAQWDVLKIEHAMLLQSLGVAIKQALGLIEALKDALDKPDPTNEAALDNAITSVRSEQQAVNVKAVVPNANPIPSWRIGVTSVVPNSGAAHRAVVLANTRVPAPPNPAALATMLGDVRAEYRSKIAATGPAQVEAELRARFADEPQYLTKIMDWIGKEATP